MHRGALKHHVKYQSVVQSLSPRDISGYLSKGNSSSVSCLLLSLCVIKIYRCGMYDEKQNLQTHQKSLWVLLDFHPG